MLVSSVENENESAAAMFEEEEKHTTTITYPLQIIRKEHV